MMKKIAYCFLLVASLFMFVPVASSLASMFCNTAFLFFCCKDE